MTTPRLQMPRCPECGSDETATAYAFMGMTTFCCDDCGHTWRGAREPKALISLPPLNKRRSARARATKDSRGLGH